MPLAEAGRNHASNAGRFHADLDSAGTLCAAALIGVLGVFGPYATGVFTSHDEACTLGVSMTSVPLESACLRTAYAVFWIVLFLATMPCNFHALDEKLLFSTVKAVSRQSFVKKLDIIGARKQRFGIRIGHRGICCPEQ